MQPNIPKLEDVPDHELLPALCPEKNDILFGAWCSCMRYTMQQDWMMKRFRADTGNTFELPEDVKDVGKPGEREFMIAFALWFNQWIWGRS
jgi:hypothetical protein